MNNIPLGYMRMHWRFSNLLLDYNLSPNCPRLFPVFPADYDKEHTVHVGVTAQQRMLTSSWHLILPLFYLDVRVCTAPVLFFFLSTLILITARYHHMSSLKYKKKCFSLSFVQVILDKELSLSQFWGQIMFYSLLWQEIRVRFTSFYVLTLSNTMDNGVSKMHLHCNFIRHCF